MKNYKGIIFDLDGVVWHGTKPIPGVADAINSLRDKGKRLAFVTNNASETREYQWKKLVGMGVNAKLHEVITSGYAAAHFLKEGHGALEVYVMGTEQLEEEFRKHGHRIVADKAKAVVVGFDRQFSYDKLNCAFQNLHTHHGLFVACNENPLYPAEDGPRPGVGPSVKALAYCVGREPDLVVGKPNAPIMELTLKTLELPAEDCLIVGDILDMDIIWGTKHGVDSLYVLSGIGTREDIPRLGIEPTYILNSAAELPGAMLG